MSEEPQTLADLVREAAREPVPGWGDKPARFNRCGCCQRLFITSDLARIFCAKCDSANPIEKPDNS